MKTLSLQDNLTQLTLAPAIGGSIANWVVKQSGQPLLRHNDEQSLQSGSPRRLGCYPLAPWSNRIGQGGFATPDGWLALPANAENSPFPIHGSAWQQPWQVVSHEAQSAVLRLDSSVPFAFTAEQHFQLHDGRLDIYLKVTHMAPQANWYGLGLHPYFPRTSHTRLQAASKQVWQSRDDQLPDQQEELPADWNFLDEQTLPDRLVDHAFTEWDGRALIIEPELGYQLDIQAEGCELYLLFCPENMPFFCFEPVTHPVNAHHLAGRPGLKLLNHQEHMALSFSLQYQPL